MLKQVPKKVSIIIEFCPEFPKKIIHWCNKVFEKSKSKQNIIYETPQKHRGRTRKEMWNEIIIRNGEAKNQSIPRIFFILVIKLVAFHERKLLHTRLCPGNRFKKPVKLLHSTFPSHWTIIASPLNKIWGKITASFPQTNWNISSLIWSHLRVAADAKMY